MLVELTLQPGASVARIAREHDVNANQVFNWRKLYEAGQLEAGASTQRTALLPVVMTTPAQELASTGFITLEIGGIKLRVEGQADAALLALVLERVLR